MITEDYVSFETAKLLKEKGFDENTNNQYPVGGIHIGEVGEYNITDRSRNPENYIPAPTLQMAMKWLREVHKVDMWVECHNSNRRYKGYIHSEQRGDEVLFYEDSYEQACEAAIQYCLQNLI